MVTVMFINSATPPYLATFSIAVARCSIHYCSQPLDGASIQQVVSNPLPTYSRNPLWVVQHLLPTFPDVGALAFSRLSDALVDSAADQAC